MGQGLVVLGISGPSSCGWSPGELLKSSGKTGPRVCRAVRKSYHHPTQRSTMLCGPVGTQGGAGSDGGEPRAPDSAVGETQPRPGHPFSGGGTRGCGQGCERHSLSHGALSKRLLCAWRHPRGTAVSRAAAPAVSEEPCCVLTVRTGVPGPGEEGAVCRVAGGWGSRGRGIFMTQIQPFVELDLDGDPPSSDLPPCESNTTRA